MNSHHTPVVCITGNSATYSPDIRRRTLLLELFLEEMQAEDRAIKHPLNDAAILARRTEILAVLWTLVKAWLEAGYPKPSSSHPSFPIWAKLVGGIIENAGLASPCTEPKSELSGDPDTLDMAKLVNSLGPKRRYSYAELIDQCQTYGLFGSLVPEDGEQDRSQRTTFSKLIRRYTGRVLAGRFRFFVGDQGGGAKRFFFVERLRPNDDL